jgi:hypothetical protein
VPLREPVPGQETIGARTTAIGEFPCRRSVAHLTRRRRRTHYVVSRKLSMVLTDLIVAFVNVFFWLVVAILLVAIVVRYV